MNRARNLILVGPTGAGKSAIGARLAPGLGLTLFDVDREIERAAGRSLAAVFEHEGEHGFRARERAMLVQALAGDGVLLATGAGAVLDTDNRRLLHERGFVVHLHAGVDQQLRRLAGDHSRPLLARADRHQVLDAMAASRGPLYAQVADLRLDTDGLSEAEAAACLATLLAASWHGAAA